ncbi:MAG: glutathione S-transferase [Myxococcales bacterium]|nr:glutathione S-transferase [Myxococcales bacterium]
MNEPHDLYVMDISYFSGKMEAYLRYKEIPFRRHEPSWRAISGFIHANTVLMKVPVVRTPEGPWLQDTTPMIDWFETRHPEGAVIPADPYQAFFSRLLEDYADEWLWRPALHYRWSYALDREMLTNRFLNEFLRTMPGPRAFKRWSVQRRQRRVYVEGDGVSPETRPHVEGVYLRNLDWLQRCFERRPFLLGDRPSLADFGYFASMFRHFSLDPTPARIMRERAPAVYEWVARLWNARRSRTRGDWVPAESIPEEWSPILRDIGEAYLPYLHANADAWRRGARRLDFHVQGVTYRALPVVQYRVWCRERLQDHFDALPSPARARVEKTLGAHGCLEPLGRDGRIESHLHDGAAPPVCRPRRVGKIERLRLLYAGTDWNAPKEKR